ncbi:MAG: acyl-CoA thioesterase [Bacillota bacterium]|nr:acyl-CoA thioesterase [Bacillota bacterium]
MDTRTNFNVPLAQIDKMGVVHHTNYPLLFELGRREYLKKAGVPSSKIKEMGLALPLSKLVCDFLIPAKYNDELTIVTSVTHMSYVKIKFEYTILNNKNNRVIATGETVHAWSDRDIRPLNIKKVAPEIFEVLKNFAELP